MAAAYYHMIKYMVAPSRMPEDLTWFYWEAYATWVGGFFFLGVIYYSHPQLYMLNPLAWDMAGWPRGQQHLLIVLGWIGYDLLCRSRLAQHEAALIGVGWVAGGARLALHRALQRSRRLHAGGRRPRQHHGRQLLMIIIPNQRKVVKELVAGGSPDPKYGEIANSARCTTTI